MKDSLAKKQKTRLRNWLRNPAPPGSRGVENSSFKDEIDAKKFSPPLASTNRFLIQRSHAKDVDNRDAMQDQGLDVLQHARGPAKAKLSSMPFERQLRRTCVANPSTQTFWRDLLSACWTKTCCEAEKYTLGAIVLDLY